MGERFSSRLRDKEVATAGGGSEARNGPARGSPGKKPGPVVPATAIDIVGGSGTDDDEGISHITSPMKSGTRRETTVVLEEGFKDQLTAREKDTSCTRPTQADIALYRASLEHANGSSHTDQTVDGLLPVESWTDAGATPRPLKLADRATAGLGKGKSKNSMLLAQQQMRRGKHSAPSIKKVYFGTEVILTPWYTAPYPSEYHTPSGELWLCEFCLKYMRCAATAQRHLLKCHGRAPPGDEIYRDEKAGISVFEVNGLRSKMYCQSLCLLAKMFLDHKTLYYDVDPFLFYVLVEWRPIGNGRFLSSFVGYFSKEKVNPAGFNVSCILTMPHHQRKGYGSFLIDFSYLLSRHENRPGTPEKPLSDLGLFSYVSYWKFAVLDYLSRRLASAAAVDSNSGPGSHPQSSAAVITIDEISTGTGLTPNDVLGTLEYLRMLRFDIISDPNAPERRFLKTALMIDAPVIEAHRRKIAENPPLRPVDGKLRWKPYACVR